VLFVVIFLVVNLAVNLAGRLLAAAWEGKKPTGLSRVLGLVLGAGRGLILVLFLAAAMVMIGPPERPPLSRSRVLPRLDAAVRAGVQLVLPPPTRSRVLSRWDRLPFRTTATPGAQSSEPGESV
jgi:uncharacterized membrane protein required for colicin V production